MTFCDALKTLNIEDYGDRIFNSNSSGELAHCQDYIDFAEEYTRIECASEFRPLFLMYVKYAEQTWAHPEHCFQHLPRGLYDMCVAIKQVESEQ